MFIGQSYFDTYLDDYKGTVFMKTIKLKANLIIFSQLLL
jgi:hypothetical protein